LHGAAKADAVAALAAREGLELDKCSAYSDSINDLPLLSMVGHAVAVNPDSALRAEAKRQGWEIRDFRTGRKAAMIGVPTALGVGAVGGVAAAFAVRHARREAAGHPAVTVPRRGFSASSRFSARSSGAARAAGRAWSGSFRVLGR
jgi:hypothetical protein